MPTIFGSQGRLLYTGLIVYDAYVKKIGFIKKHQLIHTYRNASHQMANKTSVVLK